MTPAELRNRRIGLRLTQSELASALGVARNTVARWERGESAMASTEMVDLALSSLDSSLRQLKAVVSPMPTPRADVPRQLTSFVGREHEISEVEHVVEMSRLTTLTGAGGVGKTRLALQVAGEFRRTNAEDVVVVELASLASPTLVPQAVAAALGMGHQAQQPNLDVLANAIDIRRLLLVLDNCEHLLLACSDLVDGLLRKCPAVRFLVTSRERLGIAGETVWRVPSLSVPAALEHYTPDNIARSESVQLFAERARAALSSFAITDRNASAVARLCRRLDGIPLALELAAARVPVLAVEQLADRVDYALRLLNTGSRTAPLRQRTLRATLEWSYRLLSQSEQQLFRRLSVFAGGWTLDAAETICAGDGIQRYEVLDLLARLVDKSLVISNVRDDDTVRYGLLETLRQLGIEHLTDADDIARFRDCHLRRYLEEAEHAASVARDWHRWFPWFYQEVDNLRSALEWAAESRNAGEGLRLGAALAHFFALGTFADEGRTRLKSLLALADASSSAYAPAKAACLVSYANFIRISGGDLRLARSYAEQGLALAREVGEARGLHHALGLTGAIAGFQRDWEAAAGLFAERVALAKDHGADWEWELGKSIGDVGWLLRLQGDEAHARPFLEEAVAIFRACGDRLFLAQHLVLLADVTLRQGRSDEAQGYIRESVELSAAFRSWPNLTRALDVFVNLAAAEGQFERAVRLAGAVSAMRQQGGMSSVARPEVVEFALKKLGSAQSAAVWAEGRSMTLTDAVAFCLSDVADDSLPPAPLAIVQRPRLTDRELEVLRLIANGKSNREIALVLVLSIRTVERHIENLYAKIGANGRAAATAYALRQALA